MKLLLGADPEIFMKNEQGLVRSAHGVIPGTKEKPHPVPLGAVQVDGLALEFNIEPCLTTNDWVRSIHTVMDTLQEMLPPSYSLEIKGAHRFKQKYMDSLDPESLILGCDPDFNAYTAAPNPSPNSATTLRTAAGHIHFGWTEDETMDDWFFNLCCDFTKQLDLSLGAYGYFLDKDAERKALYGRAGAFRPKPYGLEYRTMPNAWLRSEDTIRDVFSAARFPWDDYRTNRRYSSEFPSFVVENIEPFLNMERLSDRQVIEKYLRGFLSGDYGVRVP